VQTPCRTVQTPAPLDDGRDLGWAEKVSGNLVQYGRQVRRQKARGGRPGILTVEAANFQRPRLTRLSAQVGKERLHLFAVRPDAEDALADRLSCRHFPFPQQLPRLAAVVQTALECQHIEAALLVQELDEPRAGMEAGPVTVRLLAELDDAGIAN